MSHFEPGTVVGGRYRLVGEIGRGGMGTVWRAYDVVLDRPVAVKLMASPAGAGTAGTAPGGRSQDAWSRDGRLWQEARAAARLTHPHITSVFDYGGPPRSEVPYIVMELLDGRSLADRLAAAPLPRPEGLAVAAQVASALAAAHRRGVVHRDVTPNNIVLTSDGAKVVDFGISTIGGTDRPQAYGTPRYVAPEVAAGGHATTASDVYAFGVVLSELLPEFSAAGSADRNEATAKVRSREPEAGRAEPEAGRAEPRPDGLAALMRACRAGHPADRPGMAEVARKLAAAAPALTAPRSAAADEAPSPGSAGPAGSPGTRPAGSPGTRPAGSPGTRPSGVWTSALRAARTVRLPGVGGPETGPGAEHRRLAFLLAAGIGVTALVLILVAIAGDPAGRPEESGGGPGTERPSASAGPDGPDGPPELPRLRALTHTGGGSPSDNQVAIRFDVQGIDSEQPVELSRVELRYWFTADDGPDSFQVWCDYAVIGCEHVRRHVESLAEGRPGADHILVLGFDRDAGWLMPGAGIGEIQIRFNKPDWTSLDETDDHSYLSATDYTTAPNVTGYIDGKLVWGTEP